MRPFFIYNYDIDLSSKKDDFLDLFMKEAAVWENVFVEEKVDVKEIEEQREQIKGHSVFKEI